MDNANFRYIPTGYEGFLYAEICVLTQAKYKLTHY